jgi:hypothetical protein
MDAVRAFREEAVGGCAPMSLCARILKGTAVEHFRMLSDERGRKLSWVSPPDQVAQLVAESATPRDWMLAIGYDPVWLDARIADGTEFKLALFPVAGGATSGAFQVTWDSLLDRVPELFGPAIAAAVEPHRAALKSKPYEEVDPDGAICAVTLLPAAEKLADPRYMTSERFTERISANVGGPPSCTLFEARAFLYHSVGCSKLFRGDGFGVNGGAEWAIPNRPIDSIPGLSLFPFDPRC